MQLYFFVIELDDDNHFEDKFTIYKDIFKEFQAWYKSFSILRIYDKDNIYQQIDDFLSEIEKMSASNNQISST